MKKVTAAGGGCQSHYCKNNGWVRSSRTVSSGPEQCEKSGGFTVDSGGNDGGWLRVKYTVPVGCD